MTYNYSAFLTGALLGAHSDNMSFVLNNYIQLSSVSLYSNSHLLSFIPLMGVDHVSGIDAGVTVVHKPGSATDAENIIVNGLNSGSYARIVIDEFFVPDRPSFKKTHHIHDNMVIGYCASCKVCWIAGYLPEKTGNHSSFGVSLCPLSIIGSAIFSCPKSSDPKSLRNLISLFSPKRAPELNPQFIKQQLMDFLSARHNPNLFLKNGYNAISIEKQKEVTQKVVFGIEIYTHIYDYLLMCFKKRNYLDPRVFRLLWEHKVCMTKRVHALGSTSKNSKIKVLYPRFREIEKECNMIRMMAIEYNMQHAKLRNILKRFIFRDKVLLDIAKAVRRLGDNEKKWMTALVEAMK